MKKEWHFLFVVIVLAYFYSPVWATTTKPAWNRVNETPQSFRGKGFDFEVEALPKHLYEKKTIELSVVIPKEFVYDGLSNTFSSVMLLNDDLGVDLQPWPYEEKKRAIITISEAMAEKTELYFYYNNSQKGVTDGTQYVVKISLILESIKAEKAQSDAPADAEKPRR